MTACLKKWEKMWKCYCYWYCGSLICNDNDNDYDNIFYQGKIITKTVIYGYPVQQKYCQSLKKSWARLCSKKNWKEPRFSEPVKSRVPNIGFCKQKLRFSCCSRAKVRCLVGGYSGYNSSEITSIKFKMKFLKAGGHLSENSRVFSHLSYHRPAVRP